MATIVSTRQFTNRRLLMFGNSHVGFLVPFESRRVKWALSNLGLAREATHGTGHT